MPMNCETARDHLLDHVYGAIEDADDAAVRQHLDGCPACRAALDDARSQRDVLAAAARTEAPTLVLRPPVSRGRALRRLALAASVLLAVGGAAAFAWRSHEITNAELHFPHVAVLAPSTLASGQSAEFLVDVTTVAGDPLPATVHLDVYAPNQRRIATKDVPTSDDGRARVALDPGIGKPGERLRVDVIARLADGVERHASTLIVRDASHLLARVSTDKPLYHPGEPVRVRGVALERLRLTPGGDVPVRVEVRDPRGASVASAYVASSNGVSAWEWPIPADAVGGEYAVVLSDGAGADAFPKTERKFVVRSYRVPRVKGDLELDRDSYGPGAKGEATLSVERVEGGVPVGATLESTVTVDGREFEKSTQTLTASGRATVRFTLPKEIEEGHAQLAVVVKDGGVVETVAKSIPVALGRIDVTWFPEGGELVAGLPNRVYFQAKTPAGEPSDLVAEVLDASGAKVAEARVDELGMGRFDLTPQRGATYRLVARSPADVELRGAPPSVAPNGVTLRSLDDVTPAGRPLRVEIASTSTGRHTVSAFCRGALIAQDGIDLVAGVPHVVELKPTADVGGVVRVTVFDPHGVPRAERLVSLAPPHRIDLDVQPSGAKFAPGENVRVDVTARDETGRPVAAALGVAVVDDAVLKLARDEDTAGLPLHFLLGLEVAELEKVDVYAKGEHAARAVDRLLGVQGWRRFAWRKPAEFLAKNGDKGTRVVVADAVDAPQRADSGGSASMCVEWARRSADDRLRGAAVFATVGLGLAVVLVLVGTSRLTLRVRAVAMSLLVLGTAGAVVVTKSTVSLAKSEAVASSAVWPTAPAEPPKPSRAAGEKLLRAQGEVVAVDDITVDFEDDADEPRPLEQRSGRDFTTLFHTVSPTPVTLPGGVGNDRNLIPPSAWTARRIGDATEFEERLVLARVYAHRAHAADGDRRDFAEVLYWNPLLVTGADGQASFEFDTSDSVTTFSVGVDAHDARGALSSGAGSFQNRVPFFLEPKLPVAMSAGDVAQIPVVVANDTRSRVDVDVTMTVGGDGLRVDGPTRHGIPVAPDGRGRALFNVVAGGGGHGGPPAPSTVTVTGRAGRLGDEVTRQIPIQPRGYPVDVAKAGVLEKSSDFTVTLPADLDPSTLSGSLRLYPSTLASLEDGLASMLQEPCGCFEQVSSTNYPNVLVLQYLEATGQGSPEVVRRAKDLLARGYTMLTGYECKQHGYEWFGRDPGHLALTAYGFAEFADMAKVRDVDAAMLARTRGWLLDKRDGDGGFVPNGATCDHFGQAPKDVTDAYCTWAVTESDPTADVAKELAHLVARARTSDDPYTVALAARAAANRQMPEATALLDRLASLQKDDGRLAGTTTSITSSTGINLDVEATALAVLAFDTARDRLPNATHAVQFLAVQRRNGGSFGATQATVLALRALVEHARAAATTSTDHDLELRVNGRAVATRHVPAGAPGTVVFDSDLLSALVAGENRVELTTTGAEPLPWAFAARHFTNLPASDPACAVGVETRLAKDVVREGDTMRLDVVVSNRTARAVPMTLARVGLPAGLEPRHDQLRELKKSGAVAFCETRPREVTLYFDGLEASEQKRLALDLVAAIPGTYEGPATCAYLYYGDDRKSWAAPLACRVEAATVR